MNIIQLVPALHHGDAIGNNALVIRDHFLRAGMQSDIVYLQVDPGIASLGRTIDAFPALNTDDSVTILHYALPSILNETFRNARGAKILAYHNITPPDFLRGYPHLQHLAVAGRNELRKLSDVPHVSVADSEYNRLELVDFGFQKTREIPIFLNSEIYKTAPNPVIKQMYRDDFVNLVYVGRVTPNKCQNDLIQFYGFYKRFVRSRSRLFIVGKWDGFESYFRQLTTMAARLHLGDIHFTGRVTDSELMTYYSMADVFVSMSEHEGFGVPLVESMIFDIPVLAYNAAAVPFTMGGSGVLFHNKSRFLELAELLEEIVTQNHLRDQIITRQRTRLEDFSETRIGAQWTDLIQTLTK